MPSIKRAGVKAQEVKTGFESYDGPEPHRRGMYRSKITQANFKQFKSGSQGYVLLLELEAEKGDPKDHAQFDGYPIWVNLVLGDKEAMLTRESNFYAALGVKDGPNVVFEDGDLEQGVKIKNIGGKNPIGTYVNADIKMGSYNGEPRPEVDGVYKLRSAGTVAKASAPIEPDEEEEDLLEGNEEAEDEQTAEEREAELKAATLADLRSIAKEEGIDTAGLKKADLVAAILDYEYGEGVDEDAEEPEDEEEPDEADEADEPDEDEEEDDEEEEEDDEEEADDERAEREQELAELNRIELKRILKDLDSEFTVLKRHSDDDIRGFILDQEFGADDETPF